MLFHSQTSQRFQGSSSAASAVRMPTQPCHEYPQDVQNQCRRRGTRLASLQEKLYWRNTHHAPLEVPLVRLSVAATLLAREDRSMPSAHIKICLGHPQASSAKASLSMHSCSHSSFLGVFARSGKFDGSLPFLPPMCRSCAEPSPAVAHAFNVIVQCSKRTCRCRIPLLHMPATVLFSVQELSHLVFCTRQQRDRSVLSLLFR